MDNLNLSEERENIFQQLKSIITDIIGNDVAEEVNIHKDSILTTDLELDSIEIVTFSEKISETYSDVDFATWISNLEMEQITNLRLNDIIDCIVNALYTNQ